MNVHELMKRNPVAAAPDWPLARAIDVMAERSVRHLPVVRAGKLVGVVSERDLLEATGWNPDHYVEADGAPKVVRDYMSVPVETVAGEDDVGAAVDRLLDRRVGCLPVVDGDGRLAGLVTVADLLQVYVAACESAPAVGVLDAVVATRMTEAPVTVDADATVAAAIAACRSHRVRHLPVRSDGWFVGLVSDRDLRLQVGRGDLERKVRDVMTTDLATVGPEDLLSDAVGLMRRRRVDSIPVARDGKLIGMLTTTDVLGLLHEKLGA